MRCRAASRCRPTARPSSNCAEATQMQRGLKGMLMMVLVMGLHVGGFAGAAMPPPQPLTGPGITGTLLRYADLPSAQVQPRNVDVWLPPGYGSNPDQRYPVLYMHDGQNLFD